MLNVVDWNDLYFFINLLIKFDFLFILLFFKVIMSSIFIILLKVLKCDMFVYK